MSEEILTKKTGRLFIGHEEEPEPKRILIVEDCPEDMELMERKLNNLHAIVDQADNLEMAYRICRDNTPDVIIADVGVPMSVGSPLATFADVIAFVRYQSEEHCIVMVTGNNDADESDIRHLYAAGAMDYVSKDTINIDLDLMDRVKRALKAFLMAKQNLTAAQLFVHQAKMESRQDKIFQIVKRIDVGVTNVRESEKQLVYKQAFQAGKEEGASSARKKRALKLAAALGGILATAAYFGDLLRTFWKAFKH